MWNPLFLGKVLLPLLATSPAAQQRSLRSPQDLSTSFQQTYKDLERPGAISRNASNTLRFSYVAPPQNNQSTWNDIDIQSKTLPEHLRPDPTKPVAVYLPGLDGYGLSAQRYQFDEVANNFQFWRGVISPIDRSSFGQIVNDITQFVQDIHVETEQKVTLIGESCGGLLAAAVAIKLTNRSNKASDSSSKKEGKNNNPLQGLVLVNPATSFDQTAWENLVPILTSLKYFDTRASRENGLTPYSVLGSLLLSSIIPDREQTRRIVDLILDLPDLQFPVSDPNQLRDVLDATFDGFRTTEARLPSELLQHRVEQWLSVGVDPVNQRLKLLNDTSLPTLVVVGEQDQLLPSKQEATRLKSVLQHAEILRVPNRGHFVLDENVNLTEAILYSNIDPCGLQQETKKKKKYDPITDWKLPGDVHQYVKSSVQPLRDIFSPVFISTDAKGKRWMGLGKVPQPHKNPHQGPLLFVGNHQFAALDMGMVLSRLYEERGIYARGLAHPVTFTGPQNLNFELDGRTPGLRDTPMGGGAPFNGALIKYGAVLVTPRNYYRVLQSGQNALLFPGGAAEALSGNSTYPLFWPDKVDFVRTAARFNATIVPLSAVGMVDSVNVLAEPQELYNLPFGLGERARRQNANVSSARYDQANHEEVLGFPLFVPRPPARNYFVFGRPIDTSHVDPNDKDACEKLYRDSKMELRRGLDDVLRARDQDPFRDSTRRLVYERLLRKKAPTFSINELNHH